MISRQSNRKDKVLIVWLVSMVSFLFPGLPETLALEAVETGQGRILVPSDHSLNRASRSVGQDMRDLFNWSPEIIDFYMLRQKEIDEESFAGLHLSGIVWDAEMPLTIINNQVLKEGEMLTDVVVKEISRDSVFLTKGAARHTLCFDQLLIDLGSGDGEVEE